MLFIVLLFNITIVNAQSVSTYINTGFDKIKINDLENAEINFSSAIKLNESAVNSYLEKMNNYSSMNAFEKATSEMPDGFLYNHEYALPYYGRGVVLENQNKQELALIDYEKAVLIDPQYADAVCQYALMLILKGEKDKGCINLLRAKKLGNEKAEKLYSQNDCKSMGTSFLTSGNVKFENKNYQAAIDDYSSGIKLNNEIEELYIKRAACYKVTKQYEKALSDYNKALKINPDTVKIVFLRGMVYNEMQNFQSAFKDFTTVIKLNPNVYESYIQRGIACEGMQNLISAEYDYSQAIRLKPQEGLPYYKRGIVTQDNKNSKSCKDFKIAASLGYEDAKNLADGCK